MIHFIIFFLFTLPIWGNELDLELVIDIDSKPEETKQLLPKDNSLEASPHTAIKSISVLEKDCLTPYLAHLPQELFWSVLFLGKKNDDNKDNNNGDKSNPETVWESVISFSLVSHYLKDRIRDLFPALYNLHKYSLSITVTNLLNNVDHCENTYNGQLQHIDVKIPRLWDVYPGYRRLVQELCDAQPRVRFSPHFFFHNGSSRIQKIREKYALGCPELSLWERFSQPASGIIRDPYALVALGTFCAYSTAICGWYIYHNHLHHNIELQRATDEHQRLVDEANANYTANFQKNLLYAQSDAYLRSFGSSIITRTISSPKSCFSLASEDIMCHAVENYGWCIENLSDDSFKVLDHQKCLSQLGGGDFFNCLKNYLNKIQASLNVTDFFEKSFWQDYDHFDFIIKDEIWKTDYNYFRVVDINNHPYLFSLNVNGEFYNRYRKIWWEDLLEMLMDLNVGHGKYDPTCVAKQMTPRIQVPEIPYIPENILGWSLGLSGAYGVVILILFLGFYF